MLSPVLVTPPAVLPVSVPEAKGHLRVDGNDEDGLVQALLEAATAHLDGWSGILGRCLVNQTWRQDFFAWPTGGMLRLPFPDVSAAAISYYDADNVQRAVTDTDFERVADGRGSYLQFVPAWSAPVVYASRAAPVSVQFTAGFGSAGEDVPAAIRAAILLLVGHWYANREAVNVGNITSVLPLSAEALLAPYRRVGV